ncbi:MAG: RnfABCDGE type electron transport complex subunit B [Proteobacteria bacterium]|nr:RnfABCDGE type electron transport complex subunit B [Pseudomonadota bacterium]
MVMVTVGLAAGTMILMAVLFTFILGWANRAFHVEIDPRIGKVIAALPGVNCGGCGFVGCGEYAEAIVLENTPVNKCTVGGMSCALALGDIMGVRVDVSVSLRPIVHCGARTVDRLGRSEYRGEMMCRTANLVADVQGCTYGCLGFGDCERECDYDAIHVIDGLATVDYGACVGCGACARVCPRNIITITPFRSNRILAVICSNHDAGKDVTKVCKVGCLGCRACSRISNLFVVENNLSTLNYAEYTEDRMTELVAASKRCPRHRLQFVGEGTGIVPVTMDDDRPDVVRADFKSTVDDTEWRG